MSRPSKKTVLRLAVAAALGATVVAIPNPNPVGATARPINVPGGEPIWSVAFVAGSSPALLGALVSHIPLTSLETSVVDVVGFSDAEQRSAQEQAWVAAKFVADGELPEVWVSVDPNTNQVDNVIACPVERGAGANLCASEKPIVRTKYFQELLGKMRGTLAATRGEALPPTPLGGGDGSPQFIDGGAYGYPVSPAPAGAWHPVLDHSFAPLPESGGLGFWVGASSGLAYSLAYLQYLGGPLAPPGKQIGASGVVVTSPRGSTEVRTVAGLPLKAEGAVRAGVNLFFVPESQENFLAPSDEMTVVGVSTVFEALHWLCDNGSPSTLCKDLWNQPV